MEEERQARLEEQQAQQRQLEEEQQARLELELRLAESNAEKKKFVLIRAVMLLVALTAIIGGICGSCSSSDERNSITTTTTRPYVISNNAVSRRSTDNDTSYAITKYVVSGRNADRYASCPAEAISCRNWAWRAGKCFSLAVKMITNQRVRYDNLLSPFSACTKTKYPFGV